MCQQTLNALNRTSAAVKRALLLCLAAAAGLTCARATDRPLVQANEPQATWKAGVASVVITPQDSMWMAGYAARKKPSEGKVHDLHAKALALEDVQGTRLVIVTVDLIGVPRALRDRLEKEVGQRYALPPEGLLINASHTHCGPELRATKASLYGLPPERVRQCEAYLESLQGKLLALVGQALDNLNPARLFYSHGRAGFAMNRRLPTERGVLNRPNPNGPVDHDVPVLRVDSLEGELQAVLFGYACHNTTLSFYRFCGDYAGFAQQYLEAEHPGATAMFMAGCGADQNPQPRGVVDWSRQRWPREPFDGIPYKSPRESLDLAQQHGRALANGVDAALIAYPRPVRGPLRVILEEVALEFDEPPSREQLEEQAKSTNEQEQRRAEVLLAELERTGKIRTTYPYLVHVAQFGSDLTMVALAGEVVVDYALRLKAQLNGPPVWMAGYSNDVFGYVPSARDLEEGGYEAVGAIRYYSSLPAPFAPSIEKRIVGKVHELVKKARANASKH